MAEDDLISDLTVVFHDDPALDLARMDMKKYLETRDPRLIVELPGRVARRFTVRALDALEASACINTTSFGTKCMVAVRHGLAEISPGLDGATAWRPKREVEDGFGKLRAVAGLDEINALFGNRRGSLGTTRMLELGMLIVDRYEQGNVDGGGVSFTPPPWSQPVLDRSSRLSAALTPSTSGTPSTAPSS